MKRSVNVIYALKIGVFENKLKAKMLFLATSLVISIFMYLCIDY